VQENGRMFPSEPLEKCTMTVLADIRRMMSLLSPHNRRQDQHPRASIRIDDRVDFAVAAAFREPDRLKFGPPFPPLAQR
jgi:hypothetical protein